METTEFCGQSLIAITALSDVVRRVERLAVTVTLRDARVYPDGRVLLGRHRRATSGASNVNRLRRKWQANYPGLAFDFGFHGRTRLDTARRRTGANHA